MGDKKKAGIATGCLWIGGKRTASYMTMALAWDMIMVVIVIMIIKNLPFM